jgi:TonB family protein
MRSGTRRTITGLLLFALHASCGWTTTLTFHDSRLDRGLATLEQSLYRVPVHVAEFSPLASPLARATCADSRPPEALATPDPLVQLDDADVRVSFIVDASGRVESPFILQSAGILDDEAVLRAVRYWRFRPALCNGVPTEMEARVRFVGSGL